MADYIDIPGRISSATDQGPRPYQEDRLVTRSVRAGALSGTLLAVADGHGGYETSSYVASELSNGLFDRLLEGTKSPNEAVKRTFQFLNDATFEQSRKTGAHFESGTTLSVAFIPEEVEKAYIGILGDSPVILAKRDGSVHVSPEHNARSNEEERKAAEERGGLFIDGYIYTKSKDFGLQMTRDIGFYAMGQVLRRYPDTYELAIGKEEAIIIGSDGLLDPVHYDTLIEAERLAKLVLGGAGAQELVEDALRRQTGDNVTAIVYKC
ncbi:MAG: PP2C family serine/threonine-protein phosphatase [Nitrososphaera sp.]